MRSSSVSGIAERLCGGCSVCVCGGWQKSDSATVANVDFSDVGIHF
ncbi:hypothetical protein APTSU1_000800600 [Apodemus speciosus]|uniref:Uncharacterized protein n=1 Tax=Apodemus speciosus TaxID=105296 RepID=A0ABQ0F0Y4_APOSI